MNQLTIDDMAWHDHVRRRIDAGNDFHIAYFWFADAPKGVLGVSVPNLTPGSCTHAIPYHTITPPLDSSYNVHAANHDA